MATRIANYATSNQLLSYLSISQKRMLELQYSVSTQKVSPDYQGVSKDAQYLTNLENSLGHLEGYMKNNDLMNLRLNVANLAMGGVKADDGSETGISRTISDFLKELKDFKGLTGKTESTIATIQTAAFGAMVALEGDLNMTSGGRFVFGGGRVNQAPIDFGLTNLTDFQAKYNGSTSTYPTTRATHIDKFDMSGSSSRTTNWLVFEQDGDGNTATSGSGRITALGDEFDNLAVGTTFQVSGTANNNGYYTITAVDTTNNYIEVETRMLTDEAANAAAQITLQDGTKLDSTNFTSLAFTRGTDLITAASGDLRTSLNVGDSFTVSGTAQNNGTYTVSAITATTITIVSNKMTDEGTAATPTLDFTGNQTFAVNTGDDSITAAAGTYSDLSAGMIIDIAGTASNNGSYTVTSVSSDGATVFVSETLTAEGPVASDADVTEANGTIRSLDYYNGDELSHTHRVDEFRNFDFDINGLDPAFEKAIRAMGIIAQGAYDTEGGLDQNLSRVEDAIYLLQSAYNGTETGTAPYGAELTSNLQALITTNAYNSVLVDRTTDIHKTYKSYLESQVSLIEDADPLETIVSLQDEQTALEASYTSLARIRELSLVKFM
jgi:flagellar hook-associated protein 3 FlgL